MDYISTADYVKLLNQVNIALKNKDIMYIMILAENGEKVLFKSQPDFDGFNLDNPNNLKIKEISHPILVKERIVGSVRIGLGLSRIDDLLKSKLKQNSSSKTGSKTINKK
ncbi:hypothetical protein HY745_13290 [Candidatus Desantisbacteria bacterium]|nr:hypothetical protein [Candidatus Desantisbacteria bacterium]